MANQQTAESGPQLAQAVTNAAPEAGNVCVVTAEGRPLSFSVLANDHDPDGDPLQVLSVSAPASGGVTINPDGSITFTAEQPGLQSFRYVASDARGGTDSADVAVFVNPVSAELERPALAGLSDQQLAEIARACSGSAVAEQLTTLEGALIRIEDMVPGERVQIQVEPGQQIELQSRDFASATYLVVDGGLLVVTRDGNVVFASGFVAAAEGDAPPTLSVADGPAVAGGQLLAGLQPIAQPAEGGMVALVPPPEVGAEHAGGAGFTPYDPGAIGPGLLALGPLLPTALGLGGGFLMDSTGLFGDGAAESEPPLRPEPPVVPPEPPVVPPEPPVPPDDSPPTILGTPNLEISVGEITRSGRIVGTRPLPRLEEKQPVDLDQINGVDQSNLTLGPGRDATITFVDEFAAFQNTLGVYLIGADGTINDSRIVFIQIEHADADPRYPFARPGGGPLKPGDFVALSELYDASQLQEGTQFGLFWISNGWNINGDLLKGPLEFRNADGSPANIHDGAPPILYTMINGRLVQIKGNIYHSADPTPDDPLHNPLNPGDRGQVLSGLVLDDGGIVITIEDKVVASPDSDDDLNDVTIRVDIKPWLTDSFVPQFVARDAEVQDADDSRLKELRVELTKAIDPGDVLQLTADLPKGLTLEEDGSDGLILITGIGSITDYVTVLQSIILFPGPTEGKRTVTLQITDERGAESDPVKVTIDYSKAFSKIGTDGDDVLVGGSGNDAMSGRDGDDQLSGRGGDDLIDGGSGDDNLRGGGGDDVLHGGPGSDRITGGDGADQIVLGSLAERGDRVIRFDAAEDVLDLSILFDGAADADDIAAYVRFDHNGNNIQVSVDLDGAGSASTFVSLLTLVDPAGLTTAQEAVDNGALVV